MFIYKQFLLPILFAHTNANRFLYTSILKIEKYLRKAHCPKVVNMECTCETKDYSPKEMLVKTAFVFIGIVFELLCSFIYRRMKNYFRFWSVIKAKPRRHWEKAETRKNRNPINQRVRRKFEKKWETEKGKEEGREGLKNIFLGWYNTTKDQF